MQRKLGYWLLLSALAAPLAARAESVDEILAKNFQARGGLDKIKAVKSARLTGKMMMGPGMEAPVTMEWKRPGHLRMEFIVQGMKGVMTYDGKIGWMLMPFMGKTTAEKVPEDQLKDLEDQADFDGPLVDYKDKGHQIEYLGTDKIEGTTVHKLKLTKKNGDVSTIYLDGDAFLEIKQEGKRTMRGQEFEFEASIGDYKDVNGLMIAHSFESKAKGAPQGQTITIEKIELDPDLPDSDFSLEGQTAAAPPGASPAAPAASTPKPGGSRD
jgi:outer membrane lipoprotein-sorting protein